MGATPWQYVGPYDRDPAVSLQQAQREYFQANYDLPAFIADTLRNAEQCVTAVQVDDEYGLRETYTATLEAVRSIAAAPTPADPDGQIRQLRDLAHASGADLDNILDYHGIHESLMEWHVTPLTDSQILELFGIPRTSPGPEFDRNLDQVYEMIDRAQAVCVPLYENDAADSPTSMMFVGYTAD